MAGRSPLILTTITCCLSVCVSLSLPPSTPTIFSLYICLTAGFSKLPGVHFFLGGDGGRVKIGTMLQHRSKFHDITSTTTEGADSVSQQRGQRQTQPHGPTISPGRGDTPVDGAEKSQPTNQSQPEMVELLKVVKAMNMVKLHLCWTLALPMRTKRMVNHMLSTAVSFGGPNARKQPWRRNA